MNKEHGLSVREAIIILVALTAQYCIAPRQVPPRVYIWLSRGNHWVFSVTSGKFVLVSASVPVFSTPNMSGHVVVGLKSKY